MLPKAARLLKTADYRKVYQEGRKFAGPLFAAFYRPGGPGGTTRIGFTTPRALGNAVVRNRIRRRVREAVRMELAAVAPGWDVVFNPRRVVLGAGFERLRAEVVRLFRQLGA